MGLLRSSTAYALSPSYHLWLEPCTNTVSDNANLRSVSLAGTSGYHHQAQRDGLYLTSLFYSMVFRSFELHDLCAGFTSF